MPTIRKQSPPPRPEPSPATTSAAEEPPPPETDSAGFAGDEIPQLSSIFYNWQKEDSEEPRPTVNRIESTVVGLLSSIESWKRDILQAADQQEERLSDGLRSIQALVTQAQSANSEVEQGIYQALAALWDKTAELGTGLEGWSAESRRLDSQHAHTVRALEALNARIAGLEESSEQRQETLTQHLGALVEALKETLGDADKFSHQMQARVLRGLEAVDERIALRQQEAHQAIFEELTVLHQSTAAKLEDEAARRTSEAATTQARAHAEILTALEMTARQAAEAEAAAELTSRAGHTATQAVLEASLAGVSGSIQQLADSVQQLRADIRQAEGQTDALRAEVREAAGQTQALKEELGEAAGWMQALRAEVHQVAGATEAVRAEVHQVAGGTEAVRAEVHQVAHRAETFWEEFRQFAGQTEGRFINHTESLEQRLMQALAELRAATREDQHSSHLELENRVHLGIAEPLKGIVRLMHTQLSEIQTTAQKTLDALRSVDAITRLERSGTPADQRSQRDSNIVELSTHSQAESRSPES